MKPEGAVNRTTTANPIGIGSLLAVLAAVTFGITTPLIQKLGSEAGPFPTATLLYAGAALVSVRRRDRRSLREAPLQRHHLPRLLLVALVGAVMAPVCLAWGLQHTTGTSASLLLNFEAAFTLLLGWCLYQEPLGARVALALLAMLAGGACLVIVQPTGSWGLGWGALAVVIAALGWAVDNAITRPLADFDPVEVVRWKGTLGATLGLALSFALKQPFPKPWSSVGLLVCGAIGYGLSLRFYLLAQRRVGAGRTGSIFALAPFIGASVAWGAGERGTVIPTVGAMVFFGIGVYLHVTEKHGHAHAHEPTEHEHAHRHDDGHHDHRHDSHVAKVHSHRHRHDALHHEHPHAADAHHQHGHS
jgi:drug/metabolite transporter (DMT)-like permease